MSPCAELNISLLLQYLARNDKLTWIKFCLLMYLNIQTIVLELVKKYT